MFDELIPLSHYLTATELQNPIVAYHDGRFFDAMQFKSAIGRWRDRFQQQPFNRYALYTMDAYPFAVLLMALFYAGKEVWIPGNNLIGTAEQLRNRGCSLTGDWSGAGHFDYDLDSESHFNGRAEPLSLEETRIVLFTSGSSGSAKPVEKRLIQLETEIATLDNLWGRLLENATSFSTVSHQHIYGLLFHVLWPLSSGRCFHSCRYIDSEMLTTSARDITAYWVASPAHLKRLNQESPWQGISEFKAIFSSGGPLPCDAACEIVARTRKSVIEIYGSTETGGVAWRRQNESNDNAWSLFAGVTLSQKDDDWILSSPYILGNAEVNLDDRIELHEDSRFVLLGRKDRIVKIEEKRLSLTELENRLVETPWIAEAYTLMLVRHRDVVCVVAVLTAAGTALLQEQGRHTFIKQLKERLSCWFDLIVLPRKWLFLNRLPLTPEGKTDQTLLLQLLQTDTKKLPLILGLDIAKNRAELHIKVPEQLIYFPDHFSIYPILPGVVQIAWVEHFGHLFFPIDNPFLRMEAIKFVKIIKPGEVLRLSLEWKKGVGKLYFVFGSAKGVHSSGRIEYGTI